MGWFLPKFAAERDPSLLSHLGMMGEDNGRKLAEAFLTPTTWGDHCSFVSNSSCEVANAVAQQPPRDDTEMDRMFVAGQHTGYFRKTDKNDWEKHPSNSTGHFADYPCTWGSYFETQAHHLDIAAASPRHDCNQLVDIIKAGNATKSNFMMHWWTPEALLQSFRGSETEMIRIGLLSPTQACLNSRILPTDCCEPEVINSPPSARYGDPIRACDECAQNLQKVVVTSLKESALNKDGLDVERSPAHEAVANFRINDLNFGDFVESWFVGNLDPREAACDWLVDNFDLVQSFAPAKHPRVLKESEQQHGLFYTAVVTSTIALVLAFGATALVAHQWRERIIVYSQIEFLFLLLAGGVFVTIGSIINLVEPSDASCISVEWLTFNGCTLLLVPLIVKVAAMNKLMRAARKFRRVVLKREQLIGTVVAIEVLLGLYLSAWTIIDTPSKQTQFELTESQTAKGDYIVHFSYYCDSSSNGWMVGWVVWNFLLILCATIFAFTTRTFESHFRETQTLAFMIYSHFIFTVLRLSAVLWDANEPQLRLIRSIVCSRDIAATVTIYFVPKFLAVDNAARSCTLGNSMSLGTGGPQVTCRHCGQDPWANPTPADPDEETNKECATEFASEVEAIKGSSVPLSSDAELSLDNRIRLLRSGSTRPTGDGSVLDEQATNGLTST